MTKIPPDDILEGLHKLRKRESEKLKTVLELYDLEIHQKEIRTWSSQIEHDGKEKYRARNYETRILKPETEIMKETPWSRIRGQNSVDKEFLEIVGNGKPTGSVWKETIAVSATIWISVEKSHHQIRLRILSCSRDERKTSRTRSPRGKSPSGRLSRWPCKDYLKELAPIHSVEKCHPPECLLLQDQEWLQIWWKVLVCTSPGWWTAKQKG